MKIPYPIYTLLMFSIGFFGGEYLKSYGVIDKQKKDLAAKTQLIQRLMLDNHELKSEVEDR